VDDRPIDSELERLMSEAFEADRRTSISEDAAAWTDADSPEREQAEREVSVNSWRKVVARSEQLRKEARSLNQQSPLSDDALRLATSE
jgi:hypothetical protein